jgi:hypothetical protein
VDALCILLNKETGLPVYINYPPQIRGDFLVIELSSIVFSSKGDRLLLDGRIIAYFKRQTDFQYDNYNVLMQYKLIYRALIALRETNMVRLEITTNQIAYSEADEALVAIINFNEVSR